MIIVPIVTVKANPEGYCLTFDGDDYVEIPDSDSLDLTTEVAVEAWIKPYTVAPANNWRAVVYKQRDSGPKGGYGLFVTEDQSGVFFFTYGKGVAFVSADLTLDEWNHVIGIFDIIDGDNNDEIKIYVNGELRESFVAEGYSPYAIDLPLYIGGNPNDAISTFAPREFVGKIEEVRIYNRALTVDEVIVHYNGGLGLYGRPEDGLVAGYHFDEGTGIETADYSGNENHGTMVGATWQESTIALPPSEVWVDDDFTPATPGWDITHFDKIQDGIDAVAIGGTVHVYDGTYLEALYISKSLTLKAESTPIIKGSQSVTTNYGPRDAVIFVENALNVVIEGLDIEGEGLGVDTKDYGVIFEESSGTIKDCIVSPNTIGDMNSIAIGTWDGSDLTVDQCTIENFGRVGVFYFNDCTGGVYDSTIIGQVYSGEGEVNYGIEVEGLYGTCDIEIIGNDIYNSDNTYLPEPLWSSAGILIDGWMAYYSPPTMESSTVIVEGNDIHDNYYGIEVVANSLSYAHCNKIYDNREYGVYSADDSFANYVTFNAEWNWWGNDTGPYHPTTNPDGTGDRVSDYVGYEPWKSGCTMKVEPEIAVGQAFEINVTINDLKKEWKVIGVQFKIHFNSTILEVLSVTEGSFLKQFGDTFFVHFIEDGDTIVGTLVLPNATGEWPGPFPEGSGTLATIKFNGMGRIVGKTCQQDLATDLDLCWTKLIDPVDNKIPHFAQDGYYIYTTLLGDVNFDDVVDISDIAALARAFGEQPGRPRWNEDYDLNCDGVIDISDIALAARNFGSTW